MPTYVITAPDGNEYEIDAPEGATQDQALSYFQQNWKAPPPQEVAAPVDQPVDPSAGELPFSPLGIDTGLNMPETLSRGMAGIGGGMQDIGLRLQQLIGRDVDKQIDEKRALDKPLMETTAGSIGRGTAYALPTMLAPFTAGGALASGAVMGLMEPTGAGEGLGTTAQNVAGGAAANLAGFGVGKGLSKVIAPLGRTSRDALGNLIESASQSEPYKKAVELLKSKGIPLNAAQMTGNESLKNLWRALGQNPLTAGFVQADRQSQSEALNKIIADKIGLSGNTLTPDDLMSALSVQGGKIGDITQGIENVPLNKEFFDQLGKAEKAYGSILPSLQKDLYGNIRDDLLARAIPNDLTGKEAQTAQSLIRKMAKSGGYQAEPFKALRKTLNDAIDRAANNPDLAKSRANYAILRKLMPDSGAPAVSNEGNIIPSRLAQRFQNEQGDIASLARAAQTVLPEIGSSNTAGQQLWNQILQGGIANPALTGLLGAGIGGASSGFDPLQTAKGAAIGLSPKLAYKALSTPVGAAYLKGSLREAIPTPVEVALKKLFIGAPTVLLAGSRQ